MIERFFQSIKYEYLYRQMIGDGADLGVEVGTVTGLYNHVRPHEAIGMQRLFECHLQVPVPTVTMAEI